MIEDLLKGIVENYGAFGGAIVIIIYFLKSCNTKLDELIKITNRNFALSMALVDKKTREKLSNITGEEKGS